MIAVTGTLLSTLAPEPCPPSKSELPFTSLLSPEAHALTKDWSFDLELLLVNE